MREQVLEVAEQMVQERGLNAVSFQQLADAVGLSKTSVFHHFPSKEALASALVERCQSKYGEMYAKVIESRSTAPEKLREIAGIFEEGLLDNRLCLLGALGQSAPSLSMSVQDELKRSATCSIERYAQVFEQGRREESLQFEGAPADAAASLLALLEGLQVLARAKQDVELFRRASHSYIASLTAASNSGH